MKSKILHSSCNIIKSLCLVLIFIGASFGSSLKANSPSTPELTIAAPTALAATSVTATSFQANWSAVAGASSYRLYVEIYGRSFMGQEIWAYLNNYNGKLVGTSTFEIVTGLSANTRYRFSVKANQLTDESPLSNRESVTTKPEKPVMYDATNVTPVSFTATWSTVAEATSYKLTVFYRSSGTIRFFDFTTTSTSYNVTNLIPNTKYEFGVVAYIEKAASENSNLENITLPEATPPVVKEAIYRSATSFRANWNTKPGATTYKLYVKERISKIGWSSVKGYDGIEVTGGKHDVNGLKPFTEYKYQMKAIYDLYESDFSEEIFVTTKPTPPVLNNATSINANSFTIGWSSVAGATGYSLLITSATPGAVPSGYFPKTLGNVTAHTVTGLKPDVLYNVWVSVITADDQSLASNQVDVTTALDPPGVKAATNVLSTSFQANWEADAKATGYKLYVYRVSDKQWVPGYYGKTVSGTSDVISGLNPSTHYRYTVTTLMGGVESDHSNIINVNTLAAQPASYTLVLSSSPAGAGTLSGGGTFNAGTNVTAFAMANAGYTFVNWTENGNVVSASNSYPFQINSDRTLVANFIQQSAQTYTVAVSASPDNMGTVSGGGTFAEGSSVTVNAMPKSKLFKFARWEENGKKVSIDAKYTFTLTKDRNLTAHFESIQGSNYTVSLTASPIGAGVLTGEGTYASGTSVTVMATPAAGFNFVNWTEGGKTVSPSASYTFNISANRNLVANFEAQQITNYTVALTASPAGAGVLTGDGTYATGTSVTVTATPAAGYNFVNWTEGGTAVSSAASYMFNISANRNLVANFEQKPDSIFTVALTAAPVGAGTLTGAGTFASGASVTVNATPAAGYKFQNWKEGGTVVSTSASYTFNITANRNLVANFELKNYTVQASHTPAVGGSISFTSQTFAHGTNATIVATPATGYKFVNWKQGNNVVSQTESYTFSVLNNINLQATFELKTSADQVSSLVMKAYPNPVNNLLNLSGVPMGYRVTISSITGHKIMQAVGNGEVMQIDVNAMPKGVYLINAQGEQGSYILRFVKN